MTMDGNQSKTDIDATANEASAFLKSGMQHNSLSEAVFQADESIIHSDVNANDRLKISQALAPKLAQEGILGRSISEFGKTNFDELSNGDGYIEMRDLDTVLNAGLESTRPVKGTMARTMKDRYYDQIVMANKDDGGDLAKERAKGISGEDLRKWGQSRLDASLNAKMGNKMINHFGTTEQWEGLAGSDGLIKKGDLKNAIKDTTRYNDSERATLNFMHDNFKQIQEFKSGDSNSEMSLSDVVGWATKHAGEVERAKPTDSNTIVANINERELIDSTANLGVQAIEAGLKNGTVTHSLREFDQYLNKKGYTQPQIVEINSSLQSKLNGNNQLDRVVGQYGLENFDNLKGDDKYVHPTEMDPILFSQEAGKHPSEMMVLSMLKNRSGDVALAHDDVTATKGDAAEQKPGFSKNDAKAFQQGAVENKYSVDMSKNLVNLFGAPEDFVRLSEGLRELSAEQFENLRNGTMSNEEFAKSFNVTEEEIERGKKDTLRFNDTERNTLAYMGDNWKAIRESNKDDGKNITFFDIHAHAGKFGISTESLRREAELKKTGIDETLLPDVLKGVEED